MASTGTNLQRFIQCQQRIFIMQQIKSDASGEHRLCGKKQQISSGAQILPKKDNVKLACRTKTMP
ncbi:MAG: hypothetical protein ACJA2P_002546 [Rhodoferax sp.]|jgi:hypothetical protein